MTHTVKKLMQWLFLAVFIGLFILGRIQIWMVIFLGSVVAATYLGRFYCGWICPTNTIMEGIHWIHGKLGVQPIKTPRWLQKPVFRYGIFALFLAILVFVQLTGKKLPVIVILTAAGVLLAIIFEPALWHRYLCPYGTLLGITGRIARRHLIVENENCIKCGLCKKVCPAEAVEMESNKEFPVISKSLCLECLACVKVCPKDTIQYSHGKARSQSIPQEQS